MNFEWFEMYVSCMCPWIFLAKTDFQKSLVKISKQGILSPSHSLSCTNFLPSKLFMCAP